MTRKDLARELYELDSESRDMTDWKSEQLPSRLELQRALMVAQALGTVNPRYAVMHAKPVKRVQQVQQVKKSHKKSHSGASGSSSAPSFGGSSFERRT
eukprot:2648978-Prymnesium_polylepis.1